MVLLTIILDNLFAEFLLPVSRMFRSAVLTASVLKGGMLPHEDTALVSLIGN